MGNHNTRQQNPPFHSPKKHNKRHSTGRLSSSSQKTTTTNATLNQQQQKVHHPLVKPLALNFIRNDQEQFSGEHNKNYRVSTSLQQGENLLNHQGSVESSRMTMDEGGAHSSVDSRQRNLLVDFHVSAKTPRHVRTIIDDEEDDNVEESFEMMRSGMIYSHSHEVNDECENPSTTTITQPSPYSNSGRTANIPIHSHSQTLLPTSPVSPDCENKKFSSLPNLVNSSSPKKKQALKLLAKIKNKFHHQTPERTSPTASQPSMSDSALSSRSTASCNIQQQLSSSSLLKIDSHRSMQSYATNFSSNNTSSTTLVTNGQPNQKPLTMNDDGEYVDEDTYSDSSESLDVSESEQGDDEDYIEQYIQGTFVQTMDDSISYLKQSMRNQLV